MNPECCFIKHNTFMNGLVPDLHPQQGWMEDSLHQLKTKTHPRPNVPLVNSILQKQCRVWLNIHILACLRYLRVYELMILALTKRCCTLVLFTHRKVFFILCSLHQMITKTRFGSLIKTGVFKFCFMLFWIYLTRSLHCHQLVSWCRIGLLNSSFKLQRNCCQDNKTGLKKPFKVLVLTRLHRDA